MEKVRGFEVVSAYQDQGIPLPKRATSQSAGYDIVAAEDFTVSSFVRAVESGDREAPGLRPSLVPTGLKAYMPGNEYLQIVCRSSNPLRRFLVLPNGVGVIDADYYNNKENEGHIYVQLLNFGPDDVQIHKGERIAQGIFLPYGKADDDQVMSKERTGGFGSSGLN